MRRVQEIRCTVLPLAVLILAGCGSGNSPADVPSFDEQYRNALQLAHPESRAQRLTRLARKQHEAGDAGGAEQCTSAAAKACREITDASGRAGAYISLAATQARIGQVTNATQTLRLARNAIEGIEDTASQAMQLSRVGLTYGRELENVAAARPHLAKAEAATRETDRVSMVTSFARLAVVHWLLDSPEDAERLLSEARQAVDEATDPREQAEGLANISLALRRMQREDEAKAAFERAIAAARSLAEPVRKAHALADLAEQQAKQDAEKTTELLNEAENAADQVDQTDLRQQAMQKINSLRVGI